MAGYDFEAAKVREAERALKHNAELRAALAEAKAKRGYLVTTAGTAVRHAAVGIVRGHSGYDHPRSLCQPSTPRQYHSIAWDGQDEPATCLRCRASLAKKGI